MSLIKSLVAEVTAKIKTDTPNPYKSAGPDDELNWNRQDNGTMAEAATEDTAVKTFVYEADK